MTEIDLISPLYEKGVNVRSQERIAMEYLVELLNSHSDGTTKEEDRKKYRTVLATLSSNLSSMFDCEVFI